MALHRSMFSIWPLSVVSDADRLKNNYIHNRLTTYLKQDIHVLEWSGTERFGRQAGRQAGR